MISTEVSSLATHNTLHAPRDSPLSMLEVSARERTHARSEFARVAAEAKVLVVATPLSDPRVGCQPSAIYAGILQCGPAFHFLGLAQKFLH
jgi:hypothetical protein